MFFCTHVLYIYINPIRPKRPKYSESEGSASGEVGAQSELSDAGGVSFWQAILGSEFRV